MICRRCGCVDVEPVIESGDHGPHGDKMICPECGSFLAWAKKKKNEKHRTKGSKYTPQDMEKDGCELCRRKRKQLGKFETLEMHHKDGNPQNDTKENLLVVCTACHKRIHHDITYMNEHFSHMFTDDTMTDINLEECPF